MSEPLRVIGITGIAGAGKDTVAGILSHRHDYFRVALADGVRAAFRDIDGITGGLTKEFEKAGLTSRRTLQIMGSDAREIVAEAAGESSKGRYLYDGMGRSDDSDVVEQHANRFWVYVALTKISYLAKLHPVSRSRFVIPDVSFPHEIGTLRDVIGELGGTYETWRVERHGSGLSGDAASHASEIGRATIPADWTAQNDGTIDDLAALVAGRLSG